MITVLFCWWWTWWHVFPIKSLIDYILNNKEINGQIKEIFWSGEVDSLEAKVASSISWEKFRFLPIRSWKLRRDISLRSIILNFFDIFSLIFGFFQCLFILKVYKVDVIFCKGWYVALPMVFAGWVFRKKIIVHESDTVPWLANKISAKFASKIFCGFPWILHKSIYVWQILSDEILNFQSIDMNLNTSTPKTRVMVMWWSQWARTLYQALEKAISQNQVIKDKFHFTIILWTQNTELKEQFSKLDNVDTLDFVSQPQVWFLINNSDIAISRWWATSLAEIKAFGLPIIIIPLPYTWWNHQYYNALHYQKEYKDLLVEQNDNLEDNLTKWLLQHTNFRMESHLTPSFNQTKKIIVSSILE